MKKRILLIGYNFSPELTGIGKYSGEMMHWLAEQGHDCTVLTTYPYYPHWKVQEPYHKRRFGYHTETKSYASGGRLTVCRCPMYVPAKPTGIKRIILDTSFLLSAFFKLLLLLFKPRFHVVITVAPSFQFGLLGVLYKKLRGGKFVYHIQDMQIEAAKELKMITNNLLINLLLGVESFICKQADYISSISDGMVKKLEDKTRKKVLLFPNWADTNLFFPLGNRGSIKAGYAFAPTDKIILYSGAIGEKQGLEAILHAADELREQKECKFVICGSGPYKAKLEALASQLQLANVFFMPLQPMDTFNHFLNLADVHLVIQKANASDLVMPSKLTTILSSGGLAVITANQGSSLHTVVQEHDLGILVEAENQQALNEGIRRALATENEQVAPKVRVYAERYLSIEKIMRSFELSFL
jgi:colanic acid biosynthesis glycosyl transferase WcaI